MPLLPAERNVSSFDSLLRYTRRHWLLPVRGSYFSDDREIKGRFIDISPEEAVETVVLMPHEEALEPIEIDASSFAIDSIFVYSRHDFK